MRRLGFTGSRHGLTDAQSTTLAGILTEGWDEVNHGDCVGADAACDDLARAAGVRRVAHPPVDGRLRAFCDAEEIVPPLPYLARDRAIVAAADELVACPAEEVEVRRSGTWTTVRYGREAGVPVRIILPDGTIRPGVADL